MPVAYITGGTKGIGLSVAEALMQEGTHVLFTGRQQSDCDKVANQLNENDWDGRASGVAADVRSLEAQKSAVAQAKEEFGELPSIIIANAGLGHFASVIDMTEEQWNETIDINLTGVFNSLKASLEGLIAHQGYFITIASLAGTNFFAKGAAYNASKFGLVGFTQAAMLDLRDQGIKVTTIMPGSVATYFNGNTPDESDAWKIQGEDIAQMVVDLLAMHPRTLPSKIEVRPSRPPKK
ncbi:MAG: SDR family oxidoreductase [Bacteroidota bacterium]